MLTLPEQYRRPDLEKRYAGVSGDTTCGLFLVPSVIDGRMLQVQASSDFGWEHISVSILRKRFKRAPSWPEMKQIKELFWEPEDTVLQYHPPKSKHVSNVEALHLWRPTDHQVPVPHPMLVGVPGEDVILGREKWTAIVEFRGVSILAVDAEAVQELDPRILRRLAVQIQRDLPTMFESWAHQIEAAEE